MKWLHLSDIHYNPENDGKSIYELRKKLPAYLQEQKIIADCLFVTGDFRNAKYQTDDGDEGVVSEVVQFMLEVADAAQIKYSNIHVVPGNHDLTRILDNSRFDDIRNKYDPHVGRFDADEMSFVLERFGFYKKVINKLRTYGVEEIWPWPSLHMGRCFNGYSILYLNTNVICNTDSDRGNLLIGSYDLYRELEKMNRENPDAPIIVLAHHGIDNFREDERKEVERLFENYPVKLYLCGDAHKPWRRTTNNVLEITMGSLVYESMSRVVFSVGEILQDAYSIEAHEWDSDEGEWGPYSQFNKRFRKWLLSRDGFQKTFATVITSERPAVPTGCFLGRESVMSTINDDLQQESNIILIHGMGGIGKSELCRKLFMDYSAITGTNHYKKIGWITYNDSLRSSFYNRFTEINSKNISIDDYWETAVNYLNREGRQLLLIIDDANTLNYMEVSELSKLGCKVLITSREKYDKIPVINLDSLGLEDCRKLYRKHSEDDISSNETIDQIIERAARHTLSIELLAKTQYSAGISAQELYEEILKSGFDLSEILEEVTYQHNPEQRSEETINRRFIEHMGKIFDISKIKGRSGELHILQQISLLAPNVMIPINLIKKWLDLETLNDLNALVYKGWLNKRTKGTQFIIMHSVIASVVQHMVMPEYQMVDTLVGNVSIDLRVKTEEIFTDKLDLLAHAESIKQAVSIHMVSMHTENYARLLRNIGFMYYEQRRFGQALELYYDALEIRREVLGEIHADIADIYNCVGHVYYLQEEYEQALDLYRKALKIRKHTLGINHPATADAYNNVGLIYARSREYEKALKLYKKALEIREKVWGNIHPDTAASLVNIAHIYCEVGKYEKALEMGLKALEIAKKTLGEFHPDITYAYHLIAKVYKEQGEYEQALKIQYKTLEIKERTLGKEHLDIAISYANIANIYLEQGEDRKALELYHRVVGIVEKQELGKNRITAAFYYGKIADIYLNQGENRKALEMFEKALKISREVYGEEHVVSLSFNYEISELRKMENLSEASPRNNIVKFRKK